MSTPSDIARIERDLAFQRRVWRVERAGWAGMAVLVLAALLGLSGGGGPLGEGRRSGGGVEVTWPLVARLGRTDPIHVLLPPGAGAAELRLSEDLPDRWRLRDSTPPAAAAASGAGAILLRFDRAADGAARVALHVEPIGGPGPRRLRLSAAGQAFDLPVFVWP